MSALAQLQRQVQRHVLIGTLAASLAVKGTRAVSARTRLRVYREAYYLRLTEVLGIHYPGLAKLLGEEAFRDLARAYSDAAPSRFYSARHFGHRLAGFLAAEQPYADAPRLAEMARWEWAVAYVFDAPDVTPVTKESLKTVPPGRWPTLKFRFHSAIRVLATGWNTAAVWAALNREESVPDPVQTVSRQYWAIWRHGLDVFFAEISRADVCALRAAKRGECFARVCSLRSGVGADPAGEAVLWAARLLHQWVERGWITAATNQ